MTPQSQVALAPDISVSRRRTPVRRLYRFGEFEFCDIPLRLTHEGRAIKVRPQSLRILARLLEEVGSIVPTEILVDSVWPNGGGDETRVRVAIAHLRGALGDKGNDCVETIRSQGYRFAQPVEIEKEELLRTPAN